MGRGQEDADHLPDEVVAMQGPWDSPGVRGGPAVRWPGWGRGSGALTRGEPATIVGLTVEETDQTRAGLAGREVVQTDPWARWESQQSKPV